MTGQMREWAEFTLSETDLDGTPTLALRGPLCVYSLGGIEGKIDAIGQQVARVDISEVTHIDTSGAWLISRYAARQGAEIVGGSDLARRLLAAVAKVRDETPEPEQHQPLILRNVGEVGYHVIQWARGFVQMVGFFGEFVASIWGTILHPSRLRVSATVHHMQYIGINSLWIIGLMSFLIGIVIAQQGAAQLAQFGAEVYTVNLTGRLAMRELGILMTAIMVAGRSGSAFAAQIGTMKLTEEVDAMKTIGVSPMEALVVPRVLATVFMMPLLGFYSTVLAVIGGAFISNFALGLPFFTFLRRIQEVVPLTDVWVGILKAPVFAMIVGLAGCYQGMQVKSDAEEVGLRTTQAVVTAIFTVIVLDAFFAVFFTKIGWA